MLYSTENTWESHLLYSFSKTFSLLKFGYHTNTLQFGCYGIKRYIIRTGSHSTCMFITAGLSGVLIVLVLYYRPDTDEEDYDSGKPHLSHLCEKCKKLGCNCRGRRGW